MSDGAVKILPGSTEWLQYISPSKMAAIVGVSRYESPFRLWHRMRGLVAPEPPSELFDIGHDLEPYAANRWIRKNPGWKISPGEVQFVIPESKWGFPAAVTLDRRASRGSWRRVVEFKSARTLYDIETFGDDLTGDVPEDFAVQVTGQMLLTGWTKHPGQLLVVGPYFSERQYEIEYDRSVASWIIAECAKFYESLQSDIPPPLDDSIACYQCLKQLHPDVEAGEVVNIEPGLAMDYLTAIAEEKVVSAATQGVKNRLLAAMGRAQYAKVGDVTVADRRNNGKGGVSLYAGRAATPDDIRHLAGDLSIEGQLSQ